MTYMECKQQIVIFSIQPLGWIPWLAFGYDYLKKIFLRLSDVGIIDAVFLFQKIILAFNL